MTLKGRARSSSSRGDGGGAAQSLLPSSRVFTSTINPGGSTSGSASALRAMDRSSRLSVISLLAAAVAAVLISGISAEDDVRSFLDPHNRARASVGVGPLVWDERVAAYARDYAGRRAVDCALTHSGGPYGENIFWGSATSYSNADAVEAWVSEKANYDYQSNSCVGGKECRHYTQVVWRASTKLGCARIRCKSGGALFITCNYAPPGNYVSQRPY